MKLAGKSAVVTGAGSGIGRGIALAFADAGTNVVVVDIEGAKAEAVAAEVAARGVRSSSFAADVRDPAAVAAMADHGWSALGRIDILCNNAGVCLTGPGFDISDTDFRWQLDVNVVGVFNGMREFGRRFREQGGPAWIVSTGSHHSIGAPTKGIAAYVASKHAVLGLSEAFRTEYGPAIGVGVLCPGIVNTSIWDAGRNRPAEYGGKVSGDPRNQQAMLDLGMNPERVGQLVAAGIENEDFYIWTHPQDLDLIEKRYAEGRDTITRQWPDGPTAEHKMTPHEV